MVIQTLPAVVLGLYTGWFHRHALLGGRDHSWDCDGRITRLLDIRISAADW